jgi:hypothetical protein
VSTAYAEGTGSPCESRELFPSRVWIIPLMDGSTFRSHLGNAQSIAPLDAVLKQAEEFVKGFDLEV